MEQWLAEICHTETPHASIIAYYFGILETPNGYQIYLVGSSAYDPNNDDWACNSDFEPANKYFPLTGEDYAGLEWSDLLKVVKSKLTDFIKTDIFKSSFLTHATAIAVGFDDGDLYLLTP